MSYSDFVRSAEAIAPVMADAPGRAVGETILAAIRATRAVTTANTNLGIVLLLAPLAACGDCATIDEYRAKLAEVLGSTTVGDCRAVYGAIRLAVPGGMGSAESQDVAEVPTVTLLEAMRLAEGRDGVARQYADSFAEVLGFGLEEAGRCWASLGRVGPMVQQLQLFWLAEQPDTLIARKQGADAAREVSTAARFVLRQGGVATEEGRSWYARLDATLRKSRRNPGTTADLVTACLFLMLRLGKMPADAPI